MAHNNRLPYSIGIEAFKTGFDTEIVDFFVDYKDVSLLDTFTSCKLVFRDNNSLTSEALGEEVGTIEMRTDKDDGAEKNAAVVTFSDTLKKSILGDLKTRLVFVALVLEGGTGDHESFPLWHAQAEIFGVV